MPTTWCNGVVVAEKYNALEDGPLQEEIIPLAWNFAHVMRRYADAWRTLLRIPIYGLWPASYSISWPAYHLEWSDVVASVGTEAYFDWVRDRNSGQGPKPSAK